MYGKVDIFLHICACIFYLFCDFNLLQSLWCYSTFSKQQTEEQDKVFLYLPSKKKIDIRNVVIRQIIFYILPTFAICIFLRLACHVDIFHELLVRVAFLLVMAILSFTYSPERKNIRELNNLDIGHGAALWYYVNYLKLFLPFNLLERVECFKSYNKVPMEKKLFILVPKSCKVHPYLDCDTELIERCRELPKYEETRAGLKGRVYNITVYSIRQRHEMKWVRLAIEYAQPLKGLYALKEKHVITEEEMLNERRIFLLTLQEFLRDQNNSYKFCELIDYDDDEKGVYEIFEERLFN